MDEIKLLREQIEILKKTVEVQDDLIRTLRYSQPMNFIPYVSFNTCQHEYPQGLRGSIAPLSCIKCGQSADTYTITSTGTQTF